MSLRIFNTLSQSKEPFEPRTAGRAAVYVCGPTVYDLSHIGHARCYVAFDVIVRYLRFARARRARTSATSPTSTTRSSSAPPSWARIPSPCRSASAPSTAADMAALRCLPPDVEPQASPSTSPRSSTSSCGWCATGTPTRSAGDVYFAVRSFPQYGKLSKRKIDDLQSGARVEVDEQKRDPLDFALWKAAKPGEPSWDSPWGPGGPAGTSSARP